MALSNINLTKRVWDIGSNAFQKRIPDPTQASMAETTAALFDPKNAVHRAWFGPALATQMGPTYVKSKRWENFLDFLFRGQLELGNSVQEIQLGLLKAHQYTDDPGAALFDVDFGKVAETFNPINYRVKYKFSVNRLITAADFAEEGGLDAFVMAQIAAAYTSANLDTYNALLQLFSEYDEKYGLFYKYTAPVTPAVDTDTGQTVQAQIIESQLNFKVPTPYYNFSGMPVWSDEANTVLLITNACEAGLRKSAANTFNLDQLKAAGRLVNVPEIPLPDVQAIVFDKDLFLCHKVAEILRDFPDAESLNDQYRLHVHLQLALSMFQNAVAFTTNPDLVTAIPTVTEIVETFAAHAVDARGGEDVTDVVIGGKYKVVGELSGAIDPELPFVKIVPQSFTTNVAVSRDGQAIVAPWNLQVNPDGTFEVVKNAGLDKGDILHFTVTSTYVNPSSRQSYDLVDTFDLLISDTANTGSSKAKAAINKKRNAAKKILDNAKAAAVEEAKEQAAA